MLTKNQLEADLVWIGKKPDKAELGDRACQRWPAAIRTALDALQAAEELQSIFDREWEIDMKAVARWRAARPGRELMLPSRTNMVVWLLEQLERAEELKAYAQADVKEMDDQICDLEEQVQELESENKKQET
jgi:hypothetical protein